MAAAIPVWLRVSGVPMAKMPHDLKGVMEWLSQHLDPESAPDRGGLMKERGKVTVP